MPPKKAAPKKEAPAKKPPVKRAPRKKAEPKATVNELPEVEEVETPIVENSKLPEFGGFKKLWTKALNVNPLIKYGILIALGLLGVFGASKFFKKRSINKGIKKVERLETKTDDQQRHIDSLNAALVRYEEAFDKIYDEANQATAERKETEKRGEQIRTETKNKTDETIKRIKSPAFTDVDRERLTDELLSRPTYDHTDDTVR